MRRAGWLIIALANVAIFAALFFGVTEWFIAHKRDTTLIYRPSARFHHELLPNQIYSRGDLTYRIGPHGLRGEAPKETGGAFVLGGSSVFDFRVEPSWPERIGAHNGGVPGYSLREVLPFYRERISAFRPKLVLIYVGWNDLKYISASQDDLTLPPFPKDGPPAQQYDFLLAPRPLRNFLAVPMMFERFRENTTPAVKTTTAAVAWQQTPGLAFFREQLEELIEEIQRDGARPILVPEITLASASLPEPERKRIALHYVQLSYENLLRANEAIAGVLHETAAKRNLACIDLRERLNGRPELFTDHVHLSEVGSAALAEELRAKIDVVHPVGDAGMKLHLPNDGHR